MKRDIFNIAVNRIISEPGDMTRYDYIIVNLGNGEFSIAPYSSTFRFPQRINYYDIENIKSVDDCVDYLYGKECTDNINPNTLFECVNCIKEIMLME